MAENKESIVEEVVKTILVEDDKDVPRTGGGTGGRQ